jgi:RND family efflux transporter MFP subunit
VNDLKGDLSSLRIDRDRKPSSPWRWPLLLFVPVVVLLGLLYFMRSRQALSASEVRVVRASVSTPGQRAAGEQLLTASGYVVARRQAVVSAKIQGRLADLRVEEGSQVEQDEILARLESREYEAQVRRARAQVQRAEADLAENRRQFRVAENLARDRVLAQDSLEAAQSRVRIAEASLRQAEADLAWAQAQLENTFIRAPFAGVVIKKMAEVGESVAPIPPGVNISTSSGAIVALADLATLEVEADVSESNVAKLQAEQPAEVTVEAFPDRQYQALLRQIIPTADRTRATVQVKVTILDKDEDLKPEMSARVTFLTGEQRAEPTQAAAEPVVTVPREAVAQRDGQPVVFEVRDGRVRQRAIVTGLERSAGIVVKAGLDGSETLVARPSATLRDGDTVKIQG